MLINGGYYYNNILCSITFAQIMSPYFRSSNPDWMRVQRDGGVCQKGGRCFVGHKCKGRPSGRTRGLSRAVTCARGRIGESGGGPAAPGRGVIGRGEGDLRPWRGRGGSLFLWRGGRGGVHSVQHAEDIRGEQPVAGMD